MKGVVAAAAALTIWPLEASSSIRLSAAAIGSRRCILINLTLFTSTFRIATLKTLNGDLRIELHFYRINENISKVLSIKVSCQFYL